MPLYREDQDVYEMIRLLIAPMFTPADEAQSFYFNTVKPRVTRPELASVLTYFEKQWIGKP